MLDIESAHCINRLPTVCITIAFSHLPQPIRQPRPSEYICLFPIPDLLEERLQFSAFFMHISSQFGLEW